MQAKRRVFWRTGVQSPLVYYLSALLYVFIASLLYAAAFAPLTALFLFAQGSGFRYLALLCPALVLLIVLPLRFSFAQAVTDRYRGMPFSLKTAFNFDLYGEKVAEGFFYALHLLKWAIPLAASAGALYCMYVNSGTFTDTIIDLTAFGKSVTGIWNGFVNFFAGIFGGAQTTVSGGIGETFIVMIAVAGVCVLILIWGVVRNSAYRYIWAGATQIDKNPRYEARRSLRGRRFEQLMVAMLNLVLLAPALVVAYLFIAPKEALTEFAMRYADALAAETALPAIVIPYGKLAIVFFACYLPLVPLRRIITAHFATARIRRLIAPAPDGRNG
ncbi:MAG: hypothetical protein JW811_06090 [Clostridiales bacterium]|nr:hypothetical protein [Clostridiales bacterium]